MIKTFLKKIFIFLIPLLVVWICIEIFYRFVPNNYTQKATEIQNNYDSKILVLGNSHAFYGINPDYFNAKTYNFSNISQSLYFDELLIEKHLKSFKNLKYIILTVDYFSLSQVDNSSEDIYRKYYYEQYMDINVPLISRFDPKSYSLTLTRNLEMNIDLMKSYSKEKTLVEGNSKGWAMKIGTNPQFNNYETAVDVVAKNEDGLSDFQVNLDRLNRIIKLCSKQNVKVLLVTMPVTTHYARLVNQNKLRKIYTDCKRIASEQKNCIYLNLFQNKNFQNDDFYDTDHLNEKGAEKCSKILNKVIIENSGFNSLQKIENVR
ncbi:D-alanyl-lipoteichoic acid biosynthesis protein DltD [Flavobacterium qiangtangense]|uniref:D-alanyl-lipoteichoic acid biosynthesis protein DltD n=1 Tax=Flavobacterium qiangtangense TaxID=1442595 RepID=A0ABW1PQ19_9FLAO